MDIKYDADSEKDLTSDFSKSWGHCEIYCPQGTKEQNRW